MEPQSTGGDSDSEEADPCDQGGPWESCSIARSRQTLLIVGQWRAGRIALRVTLYGPSSSAADFIRPRMPNSMPSMPRHVSSPSVPCMDFAAFGEQAAMATISATIHPPVVEPVPGRSIAVEFAAFAIAAHQERAARSAQRVEVVVLHCVPFRDTPCGDSVGEVFSGPPAEYRVFRSHFVMLLAVCGQRQGITREPRRGCGNTRWA